MGMTPIVVIPGVMGSRLELTALGASIDWDPDSTLNMLSWASSTLKTKQKDLGATGYADCLTDLSHNHVGKRPVLQSIAAPIPWRNHFTDFPRRWGTVVWDYYGFFLTTVEEQVSTTSRRSPVCVFGYDWRRSNLESARKLKSCIEGVLAFHPKAEQVICVTHSMGGLVARSLVATDRAFAESKIRGIVHVAQPSSGAPLFYGRLLNGVQENLDSRTRTMLKDPVLRRILGRSAADFGGLIEMIEGPMELLPTTPFWTAYPEWLRVDAVTAKTMDEAYTKPANAYYELSGKTLAAIRNFSKVVDPSVVHPNTYVIAGVDFQTVASVEIEKPGLPAKTTGASGDGTVPRDSALCTSLNVKKRDTVPRVEHGVILADKIVTQRVIDYVLEIGV